MSDTLSRRSFIKVSGAVTAATAATGAGMGVISQSAAASVAMVNTLSAAPLPKAKGQRIVVIGGGTSGLTMAKYMKQYNPKLDVVLVEKRAMYSSCFSSNLWYPDIVGLEYLANHSFLDAANNGNYLFFSATCIGLDRASRQVITDLGSIRYDFLVIAPGIDYHYPRYGVNDPGDQLILQRDYPGGFMMGTEHVTIKRKIEDFAGGVFVLNVPPGNYRCLPAPYERACLIASIFKREKIKGKVLLLDHNPDVTIKKNGFHAAFNDLYQGILEYKTSVEIQSIDLAKKEINTDFDSYPFDDAVIYPFVRASRLIENLGLMRRNDAQFQADIDDLKYHLIGDERVYCTGDVRPMPFSKSANTAQTEAHYVARLVAARAAGKPDPAYEPPNTVCFSMVNIEPQEAISINTFYKKTAGVWKFDRVNVNEKRSLSQATQYLEWGNRIYQDMFE